MEPRFRSKSVVGFVVAAVGFAMAAAQGQQENCELDVALVFDTSGSMNDKDSECLEFLRENVLNDPNYETRKPCWELVNIYAKEAYEVVDNLCDASGQASPRLSMVSFRCPGTGKDRKILLEPTNNPSEIDEAFEVLADQRLSGQSCALGAFDQLKIWNDANNGTKKRLVAFVVTDGGLDGPEPALQLLAELRSDGNVTVIAADAFPDRSRLEELTSDPDFILDATNPDELSSISIQVRNFITRAEDIKLCATDQQTCADARMSQLDMLSPSNTTCPEFGDAYSALAACASSGCVGLDFTEEKNECLMRTDGSCGVEICETLSKHINAQNYPSEPNSSLGFDVESAAPGFTVSSRRSSEAFQEGLATNPEIDFSVTSNAASSSAPILDNSGNILIGAHGEVLSLNAGDGSVRWRFTAPSPVTTFEASPVVASPGMNSVFIGALTGTLFELGEGNGQLKRKWSLPGPIRAASAIPADSGHILVAVDAVPGIKPPTLHRIRYSNKGSDEPREWKRSVCKLEQFDFVVGGVQITSDQSVIVACNSGLLERYSAITGRFEWRLHADGIIDSLPYIDIESNALIVAAVNDTAKTFLSRYDLVGRRDWRVEVADTIDASPVLGPNKTSAYVITRGGRVLQFDALTGVQLDVVEIGSAPFISDFVPAQDENGVTIICEQKNVHFFDLEEFAVTGTVFLDSLVASSALAGDGTVFFSTRDAILVKLEAGSSQSSGRRSLSDDDKDWPASAIAVVVILAVIFVLLVVTLCVIRRN